MNNSYHLVKYTFELHMLKNVKGYNIGFRPPTTTPTCILCGCLHFVHTRITSKRVKSWDSLLRRMVKWAMCPPLIPPPNLLAHVFLIRTSIQSHGLFTWSPKFWDGGKVPTLSLEKSSKYSLYSLKSLLHYLMHRKTNGWLVFKVRSNFLLDPTLNTSPKLHLQKVMTCRHPCHTWDLGLGTPCKVVNPPFMLSTIEIAQIARKWLGT